MLQSLPEFFAGIKKLLADKRFDEAQPKIDDLLGKLPRHPDVVAIAGICQTVRKNYGPGIVLMERALDLGCTAVDCLQSLGNAYRGEGDLETARLYYQMALDRDKPTSNLLSNMATLYVNEGDPQGGIDLCNQALALDPNHSHALFNRSIAYLETGRWEEGFRDYHLFANEHADGCRAIRNYSLPNRACPEWDGTPNQVVATWGEQGLGDELMFSSCIPDLIRVSKEVIIECDPRLAPLFRRSFPQAMVYGTTHEEKTNWQWHHSIDASVPMGGLPQFFRKTTEDFPGTQFLKADAWQIKRWREKLAELPGEGPIVVISWIGGLKRTRVEQRSISLEDWAPILSQRCRFVSLQWHEEAETEAKRFGVTTYPEAIQSFDFGASLVAAADLMISVTNTNVHLAGALGKSCITLTPVNPAWPFCKDPNIWYNSVTHLRQKTRGEWGTVIQDAADHLQQWTAHREAAE